MAWLVVLGEREALEWVLRSKRMAFRAHVPTASISVGDRLALYVTRGAHHSPTRDEAQVLATGEFASAVENVPAVVAGEQFPRSCRIRLDEPVLQPREGLPFRPLVDRLTFIRKKDGWAAYVRTTLVKLPDDDLALLRRELEKFAVTADGS